MSAIPNILSIDVEELFHAEYVRRSFSNSKSVNFSYRTPINIFDVLDILQKYDCQATFFVVGEIAEKYPQILHEIENHGHEIAFHGWDHKPLWELNPQVFREELERLRKYARAV